MYQLCIQFLNQKLRMAQKHFSRWMFIIVHKITYIKIQFPHYLPYVHGRTLSVCCALISELYMVLNLILYIYKKCSKIYIHTVIYNDYQFLSTSNVSFYDKMTIMTYFLWILCTAAHWNDVTWYFWITSLPIWYFFYF